MHSTTTRSNQLGPVQIQFIPTTMMNWAARRHCEEPKSNRSQQGSLSPTSPPLPTRAQQTGLPQRANQATLIGKAFRSRKATLIGASPSKQKKKMQLDGSIVLYCAVWYSTCSRPSSSLPSKDGIYFQSVAREKKKRGFGSSKKGGLQAGFVMLLRQSCKCACILFTFS